MHLFSGTLTVSTPILKFGIGILVNYFIAISLAQPSNRSRLQTRNQGDFVGSIFNSVQLGVKNVVDNLVPNVAVPELGPLQTSPSPILPVNAPRGYGRSFENNNFLPSDPFSLTLPAPFNRIFDQCPPCQRLDSNRLAGTWFLVYASDNFVKSRFPALVDIFESIYAPSSQNGRFFNFTNNGNFDRAGRDLLLRMQNIVNAVRYPVCPMFQVGPAPRALSSGAPIHAAIVSFREGHVSAPLRSLSATLQRHSTRGLYRLNVQPTGYNIDLCAVSSNIVSAPWQNIGAELPIESKTIIFADFGGIWPTCQNFVVLTSNRSVFFDRYDTDVLRFVKDIDGDSPANPLQYIGCPL